MIKYDDDDYNPGCDSNKKAFRALTKVDILQPYISDHDFRSSNIRADDVGFNLCVFHIRYQQSFTASHLLKVKFKLDGIVPIDINGHALVLTNELVCISSDGQRHFHLIKSVFHDNSVFFSIALL